MMHILRRTHGLSRRQSAKRKRPTLFLHIGTNKTGTSVIQHELSTHRAELAARGLLYPDMGDGKTAHYQISDSLGFQLGKAKISNNAEESDRVKQELVRQVEARPYDGLVISSEFFMIPRNMREVQTFFADFDCRVVVYLRRHDHWWAAVYNQAVKTVIDPPWPRGCEAFLEHHRKKNPLYGNYRHLIDRWANVFGEKNILVRPYERQQNQPDIVADFLNTIDRVELANIFQKDTPRMNESLSANQIFLIDILQRSRIASKTRAELIDYVVQKVESSEDEGFIPPRLRRQLVDENTEDYAYIARRFMERDDGRLFHEALPDPDAPWKAPRHPRFMEVVELLTGALRPQP